MIYLWILQQQIIASFVVGNNIFDVIPKPKLCIVY